MSSFFAPRGAPRHSDTQRHPASARALSLSLLLGLSPLAGITPAALAAPEHPAQPAQVAPAHADPEQATPAAPAAAAEAGDEATSSRAQVGESRHPEMEGFKVSPETLNISRGGTVTLTTPPLSAESARITNSTNFLWLTAVLRTSKPRMPALTDMPTLATSLTVIPTRSRW